MLYLSVLLAVCPQVSADSTVHSYTPRSWYADCLAGPARASADGTRLLYPIEGEGYYCELGSGEAKPVKDALGWERVFWAEWGPEGHQLYVSGEHAGERLQGWFDLAELELEADDHPYARPSMVFLGGTDRRVMWRSIDGRRGLWVLDKDGQARMLPQPHTPTAMASSADGKLLAVLSQEADGWGALRLHDIDGESVRVLATELDSTYMTSRMAFSPSGSEVLLSLVGMQRGTVEHKQEPNTDRDLDIFAMSLVDGSMRVVVEGPGDDLVTGVAGEELLWTNYDTAMRVAVMPTAGGELKELIGRTCSFPTWHPSGERLAVMYGEFHLADWALNWDLGVAELTADGDAEALASLVAGTHEDFGPAYSPDGRWMAYHSHRSATPAASYNAADSTDDIWMVAADGSGEEMRLSVNPGAEVCQPSWSPGGDELIFVAIHPRRGRYRALIVMIDPDTGERIEQSEFQVDGIDGHVIAASFSPLGNDVALEELLDDGTHKLWLVDRASMEGRVLATYSSIPEFTGLGFSPDGEELYYTALTGGHHQLFRVSVDGGDAEQLTHADEEIFCPQVSPDGTRVAFTIYRHTKSVRRGKLSSRD